jgi:carboxypeptidase Taq
MTTAEVRRMLDQLVEGLKPIQQRALASERKQPEFLFTAYDEARQESFCRWLVERIGFNFDAGRLDTSPHPFTSRVGRGDIRQTIRTDPRNPLSAIYAALHETGHALYELGIPEDLLDAPAGRAPSLGMHESQSRLWENQVGRSRAFTDFLLPHLKEVFPEEIGMATPEEFYWAVNHAGPSLIRVEADELTYNLHIAVRFELEVALMREELEVADLPGAFDERMESHLGLRPPDDSVGVLQDMHWAVGTFGYFPTYTVGNLYAAALYAAARADLDALESDLRAGETTRLLGWLRTRVHQQAYLRDAKDLMATLVGDAFDARPLLAYLAEKYAGD